MALLELCRQASVRPFVLHVNYHRRPTAMRDQIIVEDYCRKYDIYYCIKDGIFPGKYNFQAWARDFRYRCAVELAQRFMCAGIFTAHHRDDLLETYEIQVRARKSVGYYGIRKDGVMLGVRIVRPLLDLTKVELIALCHAQEIAFGIDESNEKPDYLRNRIRMELNTRNEIDQQAMLYEIYQKNEELRFSHQLIEDIARQSVLSVEDLNDNRQLLRKWLTQHSSRQRYASIFLDEILKQVHSKETFEIDLNSTDKMLIQYRKLKIIKKVGDFEIILESIDYGNYEKFAIKDTGKIREAIDVHPEDFPITIRNPRPRDAITLSFGTKNILRWCIDRKISLDQRREILVIVNKTGECIFASGIGANVTHTCAHPRVFVVK